MVYVLSATGHRRARPPAWKVMRIESAVESSPSAGRQRTRARLRTWNRPHVIGVGAVTAVIAAIYSVYALVLYYTFQDTSYDLVIFDQAIRSYSRFHPGISIIKGLQDGFGANFSVLGDHFSPIDAALAPLYWIYDCPQTLLIAQAVLFALAIPWLWVFTRRAFGGGGWKATTAAYLVSVGYGLSWPIAAAVAFDYHEVAFVPVLTAVALERLQAGRLRTALVALALLLLVKEDMGLLVAGIGLALAVSLRPTIRRQRLVGGGLVVAGVAYTALAAYVLIPAFGGRGDFYWAYSSLGNNVPQAIVHILSHPAQFVRAMFSPPSKLYTLKWLFAAFCFLPLLSPLSLAALPLLVERMQAGQTFAAWWGIRGQYNAFLVIVLVFAAVDGAARLDRWITRAWRYLESGSAAPAAELEGDVVAVGAAAADVPAGGVLATHDEPPAEGVPDPAGDVPAGRPAARREGGQAARRVGSGVVALGCCAAICAATLVTLPSFAFGRALHPSFYEQTAQSRAAAAADATVPSGVVVVAANHLGPELSGRDTVLMWDGDGATPPLAAPWVVADVARRQFNFPTVAEQQASVAFLLRHGYTIVFRQDGYVVLRRPGPPHLYTTHGPTGDNSLAVK
jgi:uncharacterized membrane protein